MASKTTIFLNTMGTYFRSLVSLFLGIFTARWVLMGLGKVDFGLFAVVGTVVTFITFINSVMSQSASRHLAYAIGKGEDVRQWFNASLSVHTIVPLLLVAVGYPIGTYVVAHGLTIPAERIDACQWVFRLSLLTAFFSMASVPFGALYIAKQRIAEQSMYGVASTCINCVLAYVMLSWNGDRLVFYSVYLTCVSLGMLAIYVVRSWCIFPESHLDFSAWWDRAKVKALFSFAGWNALGAFGWLVKNQGLVILVNKFYGPAVNAAMGVAQQVSGQVNSLSNALMGALTPEIVSTEGAGDRARMLRLSMSANRFASLLLFVFAFPLCLEMEYVLTLWLKHPPEWSVLFCQLTLLGMFFNNLTTGHAIAMGANGKIAAYQITMGGMMVLSLPVAYVGCRCGLAPWIVLVVSAVTMGALSLGRVFWARRLVEMPVRAWLGGLVLRFAALTLIEALLLVPLRFAMNESFVRLCVTSVLSGVLTIICAMVFVLSPQERGFIADKVRTRLKIRL